MVWKKNYVGKKIAFIYIDLFKCQNFIQQQYETIIPQIDLS